MHHLLITIGSHGDTHPFVGLGRRLRERGHRVTLAANGTFAPLIEKAGLEFVELGTEEEFRQAIGQPDLWHPVKGPRAVLEQGLLPLVSRAYDVVAERYVRGETVVTAHGIVFGARVAQERLGVPLATVHLAPAVFRGAEAPPLFVGNGMMQVAPAWVNRALYRFVFDGLVIDPILAKPINALRAGLGLKPVKRIMQDWWNSPQLVLAMFPDWYALPQPDWPRQARYPGFPLYDEAGLHALPPALEAFLAAGEAPIAFTFGSAMTHAREHLVASAEACRLMNRRGVLLTRHRAQVPASLPPGVMHVDYAPFSELLPRCAALVHHGGIGTTSQALAAGVPHLIVPFAHDQHDNAARVRRLGCGTELRPKSYAPTKIAAAFARLYATLPLHAPCRGVADRFKGRDALGDACDLIESLVPHRAGAAQAAR